MVRSRLPVLVALICFAATSAVHAEPLDYFLPKGQKYDERIPDPEQFLGYQIGQRHLTHHELVAYVSEVARLSPRVQIETYARTHGNRPLVMLTVADPGVLKRVDEIRQAHRSLSRPGAPQPDLDKLPAVINMGYSVHGDESSGANAVPLMVYYLAASQSEDVRRLLQEVVILIDPCLNPDGFNRFANWANDHRGRVWNADPQHREHVQEWPGGRVNYYWFDLNRDWLPGQHPESRGRLRQYHAWKPNVVLDFHEMGTDSTFFFQPGIPERKNPRIPERNVELTEQMAQFHVKALDRLGSLYFTEERFDDFYPGKGSSYPDLHGGVGILFEQGSSRGHLQESAQGPLRFAFTIRNQVATSLSSLEATRAMRVELLQYKQQFYQESLTEAAQQPVRALAFSAGGDRPRLREFADILRRHDLRVYWPVEELTVDGSVLSAGDTLIVPVDQPEYRFLQSLLDRETSFRENIFYDVSTWALDLAFDLDRTELKTRIPLDKLTTDAPAHAYATVRNSDYACLIEWNSLTAPRLIGRLLRAGVHVRSATQPFRAETRAGEREFSRGTMLIPLGIQRERTEKINEILASAMAEGVNVFPVTTGLTPEGIDLGSSSFRPLEAPSVMMVVDGGASRYEAGEIWHLFDTQLQLPLTLATESRLRAMDLSRYNVLIFPGGSYALEPTLRSRIRSWVADGGTLIVQGRGIDSLNGPDLFQVELAEGIGEAEHEHDAEMHEHAHAPRRPYGDAETNRALQLISGAIFGTQIDRTHPIGYGFADDHLPLFRNHRVIMQPGKNVYASPVRHTSDSLMAGYCSQSNRQRLNGTASVRVESIGRGVCVLLAEDANFRAFWYGSRRLFTNAVFLGQIITVP